MFLEQSIQGFPIYGNLWAPILKSQFKSLYFDDCLSHKRDIFNQIENFHVCNLNMNIAVRILNFDQKERKIADYKQKQAGAELCQAQGKHRLAMH